MLNQIQEKVNVKEYIRICALIILLGTSACSVILGKKLDSVYGRQFVKNRFSAEAGVRPDYVSEIKPILDRRCVVCHACYDAPCQLKLSSPEGIDRGGSSQQVYLAERLFASTPSRLYIDGNSTAEWRERGFHPVLNERGKEANLEGSVLYRLLELKKSNSFLDTKILARSYDFSLDRDQECPRIEDFDSYAEQYPLWGMPYGLPALPDHEFDALKEWIENGAKVSGISENPYTVHIEDPLVRQWEDFLNGQTPKSKLMSRYIYEHIFLGSLYFPQKKSLGYFKIVRSSTPSGIPISIIPSRRPYDDPGENFYYRLLHERTSISSKVFMPFSLDEQRKSKWKKWFIDAPFTVDRMPSYGDYSAANPFLTFTQIPVYSRYSFLLDEAEYFVMGFIKGPVCRGNMALNVIEDRFWVLFVDPDSPHMKKEDDFIRENAESLRLPSTESSNSLAITDWLQYSRLHKKYLTLKEQHVASEFDKIKKLGVRFIWDGDGKNKNNALTIFRHGDSASVTKGFVGNVPKTAWLMGYTLFEKIHYLLVAGYDVYGNVGHQLSSRLSMDFLRMEGEYYFLSLLPSDTRVILRDYWYRGADERVKEYMNWKDPRELTGLGISYRTSDPKAELFSVIKKKQNYIQKSSYDVFNHTDPITNMFKRISSVTGPWVSLLPEVSFVRVHSQTSDSVYTLIKDTSYMNVATPFRENDRRLPQEDMLTVTKGIIGSYPNAFFEVHEQQLDNFIRMLMDMKSESDYSYFKDTFAIRRTSPDFWRFSDWLHSYYLKTQPQEAGLLDFNRLENR